MDEPHFGAAPLRVMDARNRMYSTLGLVEPIPVGRDRALSGRKFSGKPLLEWVVRRVTDCQRLDRVVVVIGSDHEKSRILSEVPPDVSVFIGTRPDMLGCAAQALEEYPARSVVRIRADNPFVDPTMIDRLVRTADEHPDCDYVSYCYRDGRPLILSSVGAFGEWCGARALRKAHAESERAEDRRDATRYVLSHPEKFKLRLLPLPVELDRGDVRLEVASDEDWERAQTIYDALGHDAMDWRRIAPLLASSAP